MHWVRVGGGKCFPSYIRWRQFADQSADLDSPVHFVAWAATMEWPTTFRTYVEDLAKEAQKAGGMMDQEFLPSRL